MQAKPIFRSVLLVGAVLFVLGIVLGLVAFLQGPPDPVPTEKSFEQPLAAASREAEGSGEATDPGEAETSGEAGTGEQIASDAPPLAVRLDLEAGEFTIEPTALGRAIQVHAEYDESLYRLEQEFDPDPNRGDRFTLRYGSRGAWRHLRLGLFALRQEIVDSDRSDRRHRHARRDVPSRVRVELPVNVPMRLELRVEKGEANIDLSGLSLVQLVVEHAMGEMDLDIDEPNPVPMDELTLSSKMGEARLSGLGNAGAEFLEFRGRMGSFELHFDGAWQTDLEAFVQVTMGDAMLRVPRQVRLDVTNRHVIFGGLESSRRERSGGVETSEDVRRLTLSTAVRLGNMTVR
jgi:hypothetical protein